MLFGVHPAAKPRPSVCGVRANVAGQQEACFERCILARGRPAQESRMVWVFKGEEEVRMPLSRAVT